MNTNTNNIIKPKLRTELPKNPVAYLKETYPTRINGAGLEMSDSIDYITEERAFMQNTAVICCIADKGLEALGLLWFLRLIMADSLGWGLEITDKSYSKLCNNLAVDLGITKNKVEKLIQKLIDNNLLLVIHEDNHTYWTTLQQYYNYEYKSWYRIKNNIAAKKYYESKKTHTEVIEKQANIDTITNPTSQETATVPEEFIHSIDENDMF